MSELCNEMELLGKGIGNANRYRVLEALLKGPKTVSEIVAKVQLSQPLVSQNLKVLKSAHLVEDERRGQEVYYSVNVTYMIRLLQKLTKSVSTCPKSEVEAVSAE
jgi:DNA-binding transcriptional ArsR family regulator